MKNSRPPADAPMLTTDEAQKIAAKMFNEALVAAGYPSELQYNKIIAEVIGYSSSGEKHVRDMRENRLVLSFPKVLQLISGRPDAGRALLNKLIAWVTPVNTQQTAVQAIQELIYESLGLAQLLVKVNADGRVDATERPEVSAALVRIRKRVDAVEAALLHARESKVRRVA